MIRVYFDLEFTGLNRDADIISAGFVSEHSDELYIELNDYDVEKCAGWVRDNVLSQLDGENVMNRAEARQAILTWLQSLNDKVLFVVDCGGYDWVLLIDLLFGTSLDMPDFIAHYAPLDLFDLFFLLRSELDFDRREFAGMTSVAAGHDALWDARVLRNCYEALEKELGGIPLQVSRSASTVEGGD